MPASFRSSWPAIADSVGPARRAVVAFLTEAKTPDPPLNDIALAVSEGVSNCVNHAYLDAAEPGEFRVAVQLDGRELQVLIEDDGRGMLPRPDTPGLGLGLPLIATVAEKFDTRSEPGSGTRLCMTFVRDPAASTLE